ncbi:hypothetical protein [Winogradskyella sp. 3972H.M.0a.05]|uniref:hypothetical protein n=1 Tax=Winogradskyella sp. 3972H.M.0a.05 TaxID=2950277 RepID=UPI00339479B8
MKFRFSILIVLCAAFVSFAQEKNEIEERVSKEDFPKEALIHIEALPKTVKRLKLFRETDGSTISYEAKFKYNRQFFSVEFNTEGILEDIEVLMKQRDLDQEAFSNIKNYFKENHKKSRIIKIQKQYRPISQNAAELLKIALENAHFSNIYYEIIAETKTGSSRALGEFTFSASGEFISKRVVAPSSYDYVLY